MYFTYIKTWLFICNHQQLGNLQKVKVKMVWKKQNPEYGNKDRFVLIYSLPGKINGPKSIIPVTFSSSYILYKEST